MFKALGKWRLIYSIVVIDIDDFETHSLHRLLDLDIKPERPYPSWIA
jgi:hypothetical protein